MAEWAEIYGIKYHTLKHRINNYGFSVEDALLLPVKKGNNKKLREQKTNKNFSERNE